MKSVSVECWSLEVTTNSPRSRETRYFESEELAKEVAGKESLAFLGEVREKGLGPRYRIDGEVHWGPFLVGPRGHHMDVDAEFDGDPLGSGFSVWCEVDSYDPWVFSRNYTVRRESASWEILEKADLEPAQLRITDRGRDDFRTTIQVFDTRLAAVEAAEEASATFIQDLREGRELGPYTLQEDKEPSLDVFMGDFQVVYFVNESDRYYGRMARNFEVMRVEKTAEEEPWCHSDRDGDCNWTYCPQIRDGEPAKSGRHCPLDRCRCDEI